MADYFETRFRYNPKREVLWSVLCNYFQRLIPYNCRILDFGAGYCYFINNIKAKDKYAVDIEDVVLKYANSEVKPYVGNLQDLNFEHNYFDVIFASNVLEHITVEDIICTLKDINKILKQKGHFIILSPNFKYAYKSYFDDYTHKAILTDKSLQDILLGCGFEIERILPKFLPFSAESKLPTSSLLLRLYLRFPWKPFAGQMLIVARKKNEVEEM